MQDGHKFACGVKDILGPPIVYSFGSNLDVEFEKELLALRPDSQIYVFELDATRVPILDKPYSDSIHTYNFGLGYNGDLKSFSYLMNMLNHSYIDILKMDIELGFEWEFIRNEKDILRHVGQYLVELHMHRVHKLFWENNTALDFLETVGESDMRLFFKELNYFYPHDHTELSFIQKHWSAWNVIKTNLNFTGQI